MTGGSGYRGRRDNATVLTHNRRSCEIDEWVGLFDFDLPEFDLDLDLDLDLDVFAESVSVRGCG